MRGGYITARRTPYGYVYGIERQKKWETTDRTEVSDHSPLTDRTETPTDRTEMASDRTEVSETKKRCQEMSVAAVASAPENQMEAELNAAWDHYLDAFKKDEIISPSARRIGRVVLTRLREKYPAILSEQCVDAMTGAIDRARHLAKTQPKKAFFSDWFKIFGNFDTFYSLWEES